MAIGIYRWTVIVDHLNQKATLITHDNNSNFLLKILYKKEKKQSYPFYLKSSWNSNISKEEYIEKVKKIKKYLFQGDDCYQVCLSQRFDAIY